MNFPEYRAAVRQAQMRFQAAVNEAADALGKDLMAADEQFFEDDRKAVVIERDEHVETRRR